MGASSGFALKLVQWFNRGIQFACCGLILALTSYFLAAMSNHSIAIPTHIRAVEGISGIGVLYTATGILLVCCLAGFTLTSFIAIVLDIAFVGAFIFVATVYKDGAKGCSGDDVDTVFGSGNADAKVSSARDGGIALPTYGTACRMESANLAVAIVAIIFFIISALTEFGLGRHRKKEQRFGPSPANNYTSGYGSKRRGGVGRIGSLFQRRRRADTAAADPNALPSHPEPGQLRSSYNPEGTHVDDTLPAHDAGGLSANGYNKYGESGYAATPAAQPPHRYGDGTYNV